MWHRTISAIGAFVAGALLTRDVAAQPSAAAPSAVPEQRLPELPAAETSTSGPGPDMTTAASTPRSSGPPAASRDERHADATGAAAQGERHPGSSAQPAACSGSPSVHDGFYFSLSAGASYASTWGSGPSGSASVSGFGARLGLAVGGSIVRGLAVAGTVQVADGSGDFHGGPSVTTTQSRSVNGVPTTTSTTSSAGTGGVVAFGVLVDWYPDPTAGWHAGGYAGLGSVVVTDAAQNNMTSVSFGGGVFGGYEWWLARSWSLGLQLAIQGTTSADLRDKNDADTGYRMMGLSGGIEGVILFY